MKYRDLLPGEIVQRGDEFLYSVPNRWEPARSIGMCVLNNGTPYRRPIPDTKKELTIRELQTSLPWTIHYAKDFRASPMAHKDFGHALLHVQKAAGKLAALVNDAEHAGCEFKSEDTDRYIADLVICALRMANTCPGRTIDLQRAVIDRIEGKNGVTL